MSTRVEWTLRLIALAALVALFMSLTACEGLPLRSVTVEGDRATVCMIEGQCETVPRSELATHIAKKGYPSSTIRVAQALASAPPSNTPPEAELFDEETLWLGRALYTESKRSSSMELLAHTIKNRVLADKYPSSYEAVVRADWQYTGIHKMGEEVLAFDKEAYLTGNGLTASEHNAWRRALRMAHYVRRAAPEARPLPDTTWHFLSPAVLDELPAWAERHKVIYANDEFTFYAGVD